MSFAKANRAAIHRSGAVKPADLYQTPLQASFRAKNDYNSSLFQTPLTVSYPRASGVVVENRETFIDDNYKIVNPTLIFLGGAAIGVIAMKLLG